MLATLYRSRSVLLVAFAFSVMGDPVSSVAYAIEAALRALHGDLALLVPTMGVVLAVVLVVSLNYHQLYARFPEGGGDVAAAGQAFGDAWAFLPLGALIVDYGLTIAISAAAGTSALVAFLPGLEVGRIPLTVLLLVVVAGLTWFGHGGRSIFAVMTLAFVAVGSIVIVAAFAGPVGRGSAPLHAPPGRGSALAILLAAPVAMALATGVEAPSSAIAQLGQLDDAGRRRFGRITLWSMLAIVLWLSVGLGAAAVHLRVGIPRQNSTQIAETARAAIGSGAVFAAFQLTTGALLLAAASSSFQAGPGLLRALAKGGGGVGVLPAPLSATNRHHTPYWGVGMFLAVAALLAVAAGGREQRLVLFYAVAVFLAFLAGLLSMMRFLAAEGRWVLFATSAVGALAVSGTLVVNLGRGYPLASLAAALAIAMVLHRLWVRAGRPRGVSEVEADAAAEEGGF